MLNMLITGAGGFIGGHLYNALRNSYGITRIFSDKQDVEINDCHSVDLVSRKSVESLIEVLSKAKFECDIVVHLASRIASPDSSEDVAILHDNIAITENLSSIVKTFRPSVLINFSSMAVYPDKSGDFHETSLPKPQKNNDCMYGLSKLSSEVLLDHLLRDVKIRVAHLRVAQVYGEGMREDRIMPVMQKELEETNSITLYDDGSRESCFIEVNKLVEVVEHFIKIRAADGVWNVGHENMSYLELANTLVNRIGNTNSKINKGSCSSPRRFNLNFNKLKELID